MFTPEMIEWMKEVNKEFQETRDFVSNEVKSLDEKMSNQHAELKREIAKNREEFIVFKTKTTTRIATFTAILTSILILSSLFLNLGSIKDRIQIRKDNVEITK